MAKITFLTRVYRHCTRIDEEDKDPFATVSENVFFSSNVVELVHCSIMSIAILQVSLQRRKKINMWIMIIIMLIVKIIAIIMIEICKNLKVCAVLKEK